MAPRPRKFPDADKPLRKVAPTQRGYTQVYMKSKRDDKTPDQPAPLEILDAYREKHRLATRQDAIMHAIRSAERVGEH